MSFYKTEEITCPCGEVFDAELWNSLDVSKDPEMKESLLSGEINVVCCPVCHEIFYAEHFILYHDSNNELLAFVYPLGFASEKAYWKAKMETDFKKAIENYPPEDKFDYKPVLLFGLDSLVELIHDDDECYDESKIVEYIHEDFGAQIIYLYPYLAREHTLPRILPYIPKKNEALRVQIINGLKALVKANANLGIYNKFLAKIEADNKWELDQSLIIQPKKKH